MGKNHEIMKNTHLITIIIPYREQPIFFKLILYPIGSSLYFQSLFYTLSG